MILGVFAVLLSFFGLKISSFKIRTITTSTPFQGKIQVYQASAVGNRDPLQWTPLAAPIHYWYIAHGWTLQQSQSKPGAPKWLKKKNYNPAFCSQCEMLFLPNTGKTVNKRRQKQRNERVTCCIISLRLCWTCLKAGNWAKMGDVADATQLQ